MWTNLLQRAAQIVIKSSADIGLDFFLASSMPCQKNRNCSSLGPFDVFWMIVRDSSAPPGLLDSLLKGFKGPPNWTYLMAEPLPKLL
jgi:hypothetical protein